MKISNIFEIEKGVLQSSKCTEGEYDFVTASSEWKKHNEFTHDCEALIFAMGASGSLGRTHYVNGKFISSDLCFILTPKEEFKNLISLELYQYFFNFNKTQIVKSLATGTSKIAINRKRFSEYEIPFLSREHMDVNQIKSLIISADKVNDDIQSTSDSLLQDLSDFRKEILNRAFRGELTEQDLADGTGAELLQAIQLERQQQEAESKRKKKTELPPVEAGEEPYDLPENWTWTKLGTVVSKGGNIDPVDGMKYIDISAVETGRYDDANLTLISQENKPSRARKEVKKNTIVYSTVRPYQKKVFVFEDDKGAEYVASTGFMTINPDNGNSKYFYYLMISNHFNEYVSGKMKGVAYPAITEVEVLEYTTPLPPLAEQHRIVEKIEAIFAQLDVMEDAIRLQKDEASKCYEEILRTSLEGDAGKEPKHQEEKELVSIGGGIGLNLSVLRNGKEEE